ncbi:MAG: bifunctional rhamnulose-1-phosphate aldolase/short-chain dehydrogenase [Fimbriimonadaceae bacterium]|nr:bifunctional rhamnulose-1-phosphate aldolase/short-chain dehydrogenase [Fimbriimonadaceae bacterium]
MMADRLPSLWRPEDAPQDAVDQLVYASNLLGSDPRVTNFGGGNTSLKVAATDPLTGESVEVLWVKASGGDLGSAKRANFASLYQAKLLALEARYDAGVAEDALVPLYAMATFNMNPAAPSIDTPLHAYVPFPAVSHMHSDAVIAIAAAEHGEQLTAECYGDRMFWLPWKRPGFELGLMLRDGLRANPHAVGAMMGSHGFICWANDWESAYALTIELINDAVEFLAARETTHPFGPIVRTAVARSPEDQDAVLRRLLPMLRGKTAFEGKPLIANVDRSEAVLDFLAREKAGALTALGTSCPDHFLRTKIRPMVLQPDATEADVDAALAEFRAGYAAYYDRCRHADSPAMRNPNPSVVLIPEVGMIAFNKNAKEARVTGEFYRNAVAVMRGAETISRYTALPEQEAFNIEYWLLEEAKLRRMPPEREMARKIALVIGAGPGIGWATIERLLAQDAAVAIADLKSDLVDAAVAKFAALDPDRVMGVTLDITKRESVRAALDAVARRWGGLDTVVNLAAVFFPPDATGHLDDALWTKTYEINLVGTAIVAEESARLMRDQGLPGSIVLVSSANAVVAKKGSLAYDTSKAAVNHLVRELAVEFAPSIRVNAVAPATVVAGSQMFPRDRVLSSLAKYNIPHAPEMSDEELRDRLAEFYAQRTLLKRPVTPSAVADALYALASDRFALTTGQVLAVDAGLHEAFLR